MIDIYARWRQTWCLMALGAVRQLDTELWLDFIPQNDTPNWVAERIMEWISKPEFYHDYGIVHHAMFEQFERAYGVNTAHELIVWCDYVLMNGGTDRLQEDLWSQVFCRRTSHPVGCQIPTDQLVEKLRRILSSRNGSCARRMDITEDRLLESEKKLIATHLMEIPDLNGILATIVRLNQFDMAWYETMGSLDQSELLAIYAMGKEAVARMGADPLMLGFPGTWPALTLLKRRNGRQRGPANNE